jgi:hypothetical protein
MLDYKLAPVNLAPAWRPGLGSPLIARRPTLAAGDQKMRAIIGAGTLPLAFGTALGAGTAWVGFSTGSREEGFLSVLGYVVGTISALMALGGMASLVLMGIEAMSGTTPEVTLPASAPVSPQKTTSEWISTSQV